MKKIEDIKAKLAQLEALRGAHDQTMRCETIRIVYGDTEKFLEAQIAKLKEIIRFHTAELLDCE